MPACSPRGRTRNQSWGRIWAGATGLILAVSAPAAAHPATEAVTPANLWQTWTLEPGVIVLMIATAAIYAAGVVRLRRAPGGAAAISRAELTACAAGWLALTAALVSPLDAAGG